MTQRSSENSFNMTSWHKKQRQAGTSSFTEGLSSSQQTLQDRQRKAFWLNDNLHRRSRCMSTRSSVTMIRHCLFCQGLKSLAAGGGPVLESLALLMSSWNSKAARSGNSFLAMYWLFIICPTIHTSIQRVRHFSCPGFSERLTLAV